MAGARSMLDRVAAWTQVSGTTTSRHRRQIEARYDRQVAGRVATDLPQRCGDAVGAELRVHPHVGGHKHLPWSEVDRVELRDVVDARGRAQPIPQLPHVTVRNRLVREQLPVR